ncbi:MAG: high frequency lysogenization protein HflD [Granulosicoccus sp.]|nr:high frequency lysogenization protein HflD [Granulosicoccus sp.]
MSSLRTIENQTLAIAGIFQAVHLSKSLATQGNCDEHELESTLRSILTLESDRVIDVFGGSSSSIARGLRLVRSQLGGNSESRDIEIARYALTLIQLGTNVMNNSAAVEQLRIAISRFEAMELTPLDSAMIGNIAALYRSTISQLSPRIMVSGNPDYLNDNDIASKIRAALLGGIRSVVLWRQCGGTRPQLLFSRAQYVKEVDKLLAS